MVDIDNIVEATDTVEVLPELTDEYQILVYDEEITISLVDDPVSRRALAKIDKTDPVHGAHVEEDEMIIDWSEPVIAVGVARLFDGETFDRFRIGSHAFIPDGSDVRVRRMFTTEPDIDPLTTVDYDGWSV